MDFVESRLSNVELGGVKRGKSHHNLTYGEIMEKREGKIALSRGYTRFQEEDVLFAKITPCMQNGKCAIAKFFRDIYMHCCGQKIAVESADIFYRLRRTATGGKGVPGRPHTAGYSHIFKKS